MDTLASLFSGFFSYAGPFVLLLGLLIFVHELGHFLVAKWCGIRVEVFSLGFGKKIFRKTMGGTEYCVSLIPLGGYVKMFGDDPTAEVSEEEKKYSFLDKPVSQRIAVVVAGPLMNLFFAVFLFVVIGFVGEQVASSKLGDIDPTTPAYAEGFRSGDRITQVDGVKVNTWHEVQSLLKPRPNSTVTFQVKREGATETTLVATETQSTEAQTTDLKVNTKLIANSNLFSWDKMAGGVEGLQLSSTAPLVGVSDPNSPAGRAGFEVLELITKINGKKVEFWRQIEPLMSEAAATGRITITTEAYHLEKETKPRVITIANLNVDPNQGVMSSIGFEPTELFLLRVIEESPAEAAGLKRGDKVAAINGKATNQWEDILNSVKSYKPDGPPVEFEVVRRGEPKTLSIVPEMTERMNHRSLQEEQRFTVGINPAITAVSGEPFLERQSGLFAGMIYGFDKTVHWTNVTIIGFVRLIQNEVSSRNIAGVVTIGRVAGQSFKVGISPFMKVMAIISINLFLLNLLPIPVLDGGHLLFFTIEALRGAPLSMRKMEIAQQIGLVIMMTLMAFALYNDFYNLFNM